MRLASFTVTNYRSITDAYKLPLRDFAVLVGPNNEGKSNVLRAIVVALGLLSRSQFYRAKAQLRYRYRDEHALSFSWMRDYPLSLQPSEPDGRSVFVLEFELTSAELKEFNKRTKINLGTNLKLKLTLGRDDAKFEPLLQGKAKQKLAGHLETIAQYIAERLEIQYIPAIRPAELAEGVVEELLARELAKLDEDPGYKKLIQQLQDAQRPILDAVSGELQKTIAGFVPEVRKVTIRSADEFQRSPRRSLRVLIDDGTETDLARKGDGIKSLTAIALLRHVSQKSGGTKSLIFAIEEPESHLHPRAVHELRKVLQEIAVDSQVILTTHSPVLVDRNETRRNIIVRNGRAVPARHIRDVREALGVELSDNLTSASLVLLVEGDEDTKILRAWLPKLSNKLASALSSGALAFDTLNGATNLRYKAGLHKAHLCGVHAFIDHDESGRTALDAAFAAKILDHDEYHAAVCQGMANSELEDFLTQESYEGALLAAFGVRHDPTYMGGNKKQWSDRMRDNFIGQGKSWSTSMECQVKVVVGDAAASVGLQSLNEHRRGPIDALVNRLEARLAGA